MTTYMKVEVIRHEDGRLEALPYTKGTHWESASEHLEFLGVLEVELPDPQAELVRSLWEIRKTLERTADLKKED